MDILLERCSDLMNLYFGWCKFVSDITTICIFLYQLVTILHCKFLNLSFLRLLSDHCLALLTFPYTNSPSYFRNPEQKWRNGARELLVFLLPYNLKLISHILERTIKSSARNFELLWISYLELYLIMCYTDSTICVASSTSIDAKLL